MPSLGEIASKVELEKLCHQARRDRRRIPNTLWIETKKNHTKHKEEANDEAQKHLARYTLTC